MESSQWGKKRHLTISNTLSRRQRRRRRGRRACVRSEIGHSPSSICSVPAKDMLFPDSSGQWLRMAAIQGLGHFCPLWDSSMRQTLLWSSLSVWPRLSWSFPTVWGTLCAILPSPSHITGVRSASSSEGFPCLLLFSLPLIFHRQCHTINPLHF